MANQGKKPFICTHFSQDLLSGNSLFCQKFTLLLTGCTGSVLLVHVISKSLISKILLKILSFEARAINTLSIYLLHTFTLIKSLNFQQMFKFTLFWLIWIFTQKLINKSRCTLDLTLNLRSPRTIYILFKKCPTIYINAISN